MATLLIKCSPPPHRLQTVGQQASGPCRPASTAPPSTGEEEADATRLPPCSCPTGSKGRAALLPVPLPLADIKAGYEARAGLLPPPKQKQRASLVDDNYGADSDDDDDEEGRSKLEVRRAPLRSARGASDTLCA